MPTARTLPSALLFVLLVLFGSTDAFAQTTDQCLAAFDEAQSLRDALALRDARERFALCSRSACPALVRADCAEGLAALQRDMPSVVPGARRANGSDIGRLSLFVDGQLIPTGPGAAVSLDPGPHTLRFESPGFRPASTEIVLRVGERNRPVLVTLDESTEARVRQSPFIVPLAVLGTAALGSFAYFGLNGLADRDDARSRCSPSCPAESEARVRTQFIVADVSLVVGVLALTGAAVLFFKRPAPTSP